MGSSQTVRVNVRVVAATNLDLAELVSQKLFRADLFYRLSVIPLLVPPLRERVEDIRLLVEFFVAKFCVQMNRTIDTIPDQTMDTLRAHHWPGNIRELQNVIERAAIFSPGPVLRLHGANQTPSAMRVPAGSSRTLAEADRQHILSVLDQTGWRIGGRGCGPPRSASHNAGLKDAPAGN